MDISLILMDLDFRTFVLALGWRGGRRALPVLCGDEEVVVVPSGGMLQRAHDVCRVVVGALDVEGLAVASEADHARPGLWSEVTGGFLDSGSWLEARTSRVLDGSGHQVARQLGRRFQRLAVVGGEQEAGECGQGAPVSGADRRRRRRAVRKAAR